MMGYPPLDYCRPKTCWNEGLKDPGSLHVEDGDGVIVIHPLHGHAYSNCILDDSALDIEFW